MSAVTHGIIQMNAQVVCERQRNQLGHSIAAKRVHAIMA